MAKLDPTKCVNCGHSLDEHARGQGSCRHADKRRKTWKNGRCPCKRAAPPSPHGTADRPRRSGRIPKIGTVSRYQPDPERDDLTVGDAIVYLVANGLASQRLACQRCGIFDRLSSEWIGRGMTEIARLEVTDSDEPADDEALYVEFALGMLEAVAARDMDGIADLRAHHRKDWHAVVRTMQILNRDTWDDTSTVELSGAGGGPIRTAKVPSLEELEAQFGALAAQHPGVIDVKEIVS